MTLNVQFLTMIAMVLGGFYLGIALETFRRFARHWKKHTILAYVMEISFWLTQTFILYYILFRVNSGELRVYVFVACLLGFSIYQVVAANIYKRILERLIIIIADIYQFLARVVTVVIIKPIQFLFQALITSVLFIGNILFMIIKYIFYVLFTPIKWVLRVIYRMLPKKIHLFFHNLAGFYSKIKNICIKWIKYIAQKRR
ncbi:spore cortex biosynthesis protein YabQ [Ornithinibacillus sp. L9]|uniref:Spore cortex biosynthesis protein YabQ n=1 Tax=Ornithinibacillus caprae TaxID=2678566 RepID=A0A6N8FEW4_9BACI|nr:spore cortex biosynthesis protein YabQ [Ornithinibacillus caprae]MUK88063.1 spore cortex biosynthesis protein YabQ [Ornithinibacillus caprae]